MQRPRAPQSVIDRCERTPRGPGWLAGLPVAVATAVACVTHVTRVAPSAMAVASLNPRRDGQGDN
jgi:hypothetical protein